jgi:hypothetical protein
MIPRRKQQEKIFDDETDSIKFAQHHGIIKNFTTCLKDGSGLKQINRLKYKCKQKNCRKINSIQKESILENMHIGFDDFFHLYLFMVV